MQDCCLTCKNLEYRKNYVYPYRCLKHKAERLNAGNAAKSSQEMRIRG